MTENQKIALAAALTSLGVLGLLFYLEWLELDWKKWFGFALWTSLVFGSLAYLYGETFRKAKCLLVFLAALTLHVVLLVYYLRSASKFPNVFFLFFSPIEGGILAGTLAMLGGPSTHRARSLKGPSEEKKHPKT